MFNSAPKEDAPKEEVNSSDENLVHTGPVDASKDVYGDYADHIKTDEYGVAQPHDVHQAKNEAIKNSEEE